MALRLRQGPAGLTRASSRSRQLRLPVVAFKERDAVHDWRVQKMMDTAHTYYSDVWSKGSMAAAERVLDRNVVYRDEVWGGKAPLVGLKAVKDLVTENRLEYPDLWYEINHLGLQDTTHIFVQWTCHSTQLESKRGPPSYHSSIIKGVDILAFNNERDKVIEVEQYRQPTAEERAHQAHHDEPSTMEIKLARLHWEKPAAP